jgi:hypothetical protein
MQSRDAREALEYVRLGLKANQKVSLLRENLDFVISP